MKLSTEILEKTGLTRNESLVYLLLLENPDYSISDLAKKTSIHRRTIYDTLNQLSQKGLVFEKITSKNTAYNPVNPEKIKEILEEKQNSFLQQLPSLIELYKSHPTTESAYVYKGIGGFKNYLNDIITEKQDVYSLGAKGDWLDPKIREFYRKFSSQAKKEKINFTRIFDYEVQSNKPVMDQMFGEYKFLPRKYSTNSSVDVYSDRVVMFSGVDVGYFDPNISMFVIKNQLLAQSYKTWISMFFDLLD